MLKYSDHSEIKLELSKWKQLGYPSHTWRLSDFQITWTEKEVAESNLD